MVRQTITAVAVSLAIATPLWAGETRTTEAESLLKADQKLAEAEEGAGKPAQAQIVRQQRQEVKELLDQLEAGGKVDPAAVDRVLQEAEHPF